MTATLCVLLPFLPLPIAFAPLYGALLLTLGVVVFLYVANWPYGV